MNLAEGGQKCRSAAQKVVLHKRSGENRPLTVSEVSPLSVSFIFPFFLHVDFLIDEDILLSGKP